MSNTHQRRDAANRIIQQSRVLLHELAAMYRGEEGIGEAIHRADVFRCTYRARGRGGFQGRQQRRREGGLFTRRNHAD
jgi:hypothetical protein